MNRGGAPDSWHRGAGGLELTAWGGFEALRRNDIYQCAGVNASAGAADNPTLAECESAGGATAGFEPYIFAYPEVMAADGTITSIGGYGEGGGGAGFKFWVAAWSAGSSSGNTVPAAPASSSYLYEHPGAGFDGELLRAGTISVAVVKGQIVWFLTQTKQSSQQRGYRRSSAFRSVFGENAAAALTSTSGKSYIGLRSTAVATYDPTIVSLPAMSLLPAGNDTVGSGSAASSLRPTIYWKFEHA